MRLSYVSCLMNIVLNLVGNTTRNMHVFTQRKEKKRKTPHFDVL